jgi:hypothetical protein
MPEELPRNNSEELPQQNGEENEAEPLIPLSELPGYLGFIETEEMLRLKNQLIQAIAGQDPELIKKSKLEWLKQAEKAVERYTVQEDFERAQAGMIVAEALAWQKGGDEARYLDLLLDAEPYVRHKDGYEDVVRALDEAIEESKLKQGPQEPSEKGEA